MSQIITNAFSRYWQECLATQAPVVLDEFVLANVPDLDPAAPIDPDGGLPDANHIVHRHAVDQRGRINNDAVAYTIVMDTTVGDFSFNAMYLINQASGVVGMIVHKGLETKLKTHDTTGQTGNSLVKSMLMEYDRASEATATHVDASTWQIDYAARLRGMDDDLRLQALQFFGPATFYGNGFHLVNESGVYKVQPGVAYVGGLRAQLDVVKKVTPGAKPVGLWVDIYRAGSLLDAWVNHFTLTLSVPDMVDYLDSNGHMHHVAKVAIVNVDGSVTDVRRKRTLELTGDVAGKGILEDAQGVTIAVEIKDGSHRHPWGELDQVPATASRWPSYDEVTDKPTLDELGAYPKTGGPLNGGMEAKGAISGTGSVIAEDAAKESWIGLEVDEEGPYLSGKAPGEDTPKKLIAVTRSELQSGKRIASNEMRIAINAGLKFSPYEDFRGVGWGFGMDNSTGEFGFHRYLDSAWKDTPMQFPIGGGVAVNGPLNVGGIAKIISTGHNILELAQAGHSAVMLYKPADREAIRFCRSNGSAGDTHAYGEVDGDGFRALSGRFRANYPSAFRAWTSMGQCSFWSEPLTPLAPGGLLGIAGTQMIRPNLWALENHYGMFNPDDNPENVEHVLSATDGGNFWRAWRFSNSGTLRSAGNRWWIDAAGELYPARLNGASMIDWCQGGFAYKTHTHTAAEGNQDIVAGGTCQVGTYLFARVDVAHDIYLGGTIAGGYLRPCSVDDEADDESNPWLGGTWKCLGRSHYGVAGENEWKAAKTLWIRIA